MNRAVQRTPHVGITSAVVAVSVALSACADDQPEATGVLIDVPETVALGEFPEPPTDADESADAPPVPTTAAGSTTTTTMAEPEAIEAPLGDLVEGNRVLLIGDTVIAATAPRFDGEMCDALEAFGWQAEIAAEVGRFVEFGATVVEARITPQEPEWDVVGIMLGNHFDGDVAAYGVELDRLVTDLSPRPLIVYTLVEDDTFQAALNEVIRELPNRHPNVLILDWAEIVADEPDVLTADTPSGLSDEGRSRLALFTVAALGEPPTIEAAGCVPPVFVDDSAIVL